VTTPLVCSSDSTAVYLPRHINDPVTVYSDVRVITVIIIIQPNKKKGNKTAVVTESYT